MFEELEKLSSAPKTEHQPQHARRAKRPARKVVIIVAAIVVILGLGCFAWRLFIHKSSNNPNSLPTTVLSQVSGFRPYYFKPSFSTNFKLQDNSVTYQNGVLIFSMRDNTGKSLAFTEEATPPGYDVSALQADKQSTNEFGQIFITDAYNRTTGALFTSDHTWLLINAPQPIGADLMQQILDALQPIKNS